MIEIRYHGRGGQGAVTSAELLATAAIQEGKYAQAMPSFGPERRGAPVLAFNRVDDTPIRSREAIYEPDVAVVLDSTLIGIIDVTLGLKNNGSIIINTPLTPAGLRKEMCLKPSITLATVDATQIAWDTIKRPITNTTMLGVLVRVTNIVGLKALSEALEERFGMAAGMNIEAMRKAHKRTRVRYGKMASG